MDRDQLALLYEKKNIFYPELEKLLEITKVFMIARKRVLYGGMAIDLPLKAAGHKGIYNDDDIPDYDMYSPEFIKDAYDLGEEIAASYECISVINGFHPSTMRVRYKFYPVADISYMPQKIYDKLPVIEYQGMRIIHPRFQKIDLHKSVMLPMSNAPQEVYFHRFEKDKFRRALFDEVYPDVLKGKVKLTSRLEPPKEGIVTGIMAYCFIAQIYKKMFGEPPIPAPDFQVSGDHFIAVMTDDHESWKLADTKYYAPYMDSYVPRSKRGTIDGILYEIQDIRGWQVSLHPMEHFNTLMGWDTKVSLVNVFGVAANLLAMSYLSGEIYYQYFCSLKKMMSHVQSLDLDAKAKNTLPFFNNFNLCGSNEDLTYRVNLRASLDDIAGTQTMELRLQPFGYYPPKERPPVYDIKKSQLYNMSHEEIEDLSYYDDLYA